MATSQYDYLVTDLSVYTVRPVVTEHRFQVIEPVMPPSGKDGPTTGLVKMVASFIVIFPGLVLLLPAPP